MAAKTNNTFSDSRSSSDDKTTTPSPTSGCNSAQGVYKVTTFEVLPCKKNNVKVERDDTIESNNVDVTSDSDYGNEAAVIRHEPTTAIITETITTGSNHR